jgi:hypothetical protein
MTTATYAEVASAGGAWSCPVLLPLTPFEQVCTVLKELSAFTGSPITAFMHGADSDPVDELLLVRDPSRDHGTPDIPDCQSAAQTLTAETGWPLVPHRAPGAGVLVGLGLREGYSSDAPQHSPAEADQYLARHGSGWRCRTARLVSARLVDRAVRWYDEVGVVVQAPAAMTPVIGRLAAMFAQHRHVITNFDEGSTRAFAR